VTISRLYTTCSTRSTDEAGRTEIARACPLAQGFAELPGGWDALERHV
jgi:hypothetical protein